MTQAQSATPGPWRHSGNRIDDGNGRGKAVAFADRRRPEHDANARLIAAAPDLLAACRALVSTLNADLTSEQCDAWDAAVAAMAKAEGR
jgi:hypothetical protein